MVTGGGTYYLEPQSAVPLNNELGAARAITQAAEESVMWRLTGMISDAQDEIQEALDAVSHQTQQSCITNFYFAHLIFGMFEALSSDAEDNVQETLDVASHLQLLFLAQCWCNL